MDTASIRAQRIWDEYQHMSRPQNLTEAASFSGKTKSEMSGFCRICLEPDLYEHLVEPCSCKGTLQYVHLKCLDTWRRDARGNIVHSECDLCHDIYVDFQLHDGDLNSMSEMLRIFWAVMLFVVVTVGIPFLIYQGIDIDMLKESCSNLHEFYSGLVFPSLGRLGWNSSQLAMFIFAVTVFGIMFLLATSSGPLRLPTVLQGHFPNLPNFHLPNMPNLPHLPNFHLPNMPNLPNFHLPNMPNLPHLPNLPPLPNLPNLANMQMPPMPHLPSLSNLPQLPAFPQFPTFSQLPQWPHLPRDLAAFQHFFSQHPRFAAADPHPQYQHQHQE
jgi:hypothetical protein